MESIFAGAGLLRSAYGEVDWAGSGLGSPQGWSPTLRSAVDLMLHARFPVTLLWGAQFTMLYNEAYVQLIVDKHPQALGASAEEVFPEIWATIGPMLRGVHGGGPATFQQDSRMLLDRRGFLEECYFTFSFSPVHDRSGEVEGVITLAAETTRTIIDRRRLALLATLNAAVADLQDGGGLRARALPVLRQASADLPMVDIVAADGQRVQPLDSGLPVATPPRPAHGPLAQPTGSGNLAWLRLGASGDHGDEEELMLGVRLSEHLPVDERYRDFLGLIAASLGQALSRARTREAERRVGLLEWSMSETLQRSLLTEPVQSDALRVAVRYQSAAEQAQIGGDWYDAFLPPSGALTVVVGDVSGHDRHAAATMGQVRNLLRGVAFTLHEPPSRVLTGLDEAIAALAPGAIATALLAQVEEDQAAKVVGLRTLIWSNAGHPPPVLITPDGAARLLETRPELMLGVAPPADRSDHTVILTAGSAVVLYTDGLIERRGSSLEDGLERLRRFLENQTDLDPEKLCDRVLAEFGSDSEDDIVLLVLSSRLSFPH